MEDSAEAIRRGRKCLEDGDFDSALGIFEDALSRHPANPDLWNCKGVALRGLGRYAESSECFEESLRIDPRDRYSS